MKTFIFLIFISFLPISFFGQTDYLFKIRRVCPNEIHPSAYLRYLRSFESIQVSDSGYVCTGNIDIVKIKSSLLVNNIDIIEVKRIDTQEIIYANTDLNELEIAKSFIHNYKIEVDSKHKSQLVKTLRSCSSLKTAFWDSTSGNIYFYTNSPDFPTALLKEKLVDTDLLVSQLTITKLR